MILFNHTSVVFANKRSVKKLLNMHVILVRTEVKENIIKQNSLARPIMFKLQNTLNKVFLKSNLIAKYIIILTMTTYSISFFLSRLPLLPMVESNILIFKNLRDWSTVP